ncbi:amidase [Aquabacterium sp. OR-4]|uniref:amidase n=1 Tax=Aquabacterium sp. OR-4 TaxID=2978127 RepID=UPI0021B18ED5|nr:amidase [Aquabacterium sp. OR-4]MDT7834379.1 amidase [Aquabacterium sp. OR-4]
MNASRPPSPAPSPDTPDGITDLDAHALSAAIHARQLSCREVMAAYLARIHRLNPALRAIVNLAPDERLLAQADRHDAELAPGHARTGSRGWLHGIPQAIKDAAMAEGFATTVGSPLLAGAVAPHDGLMAARMKAAGAIVIGKTNMPELGLGSHTFNPLFGATPNAWDATVSAGGSSGGAAVALAQRLLPVADGSDFMGSLRNPAAWNHVFGLRPSQGRVPLWPAQELWISQLGTEGPMARSVRDLAALLATQAGPDPRTPLALADGASFALSPAHADPASLRGLRIGWLGDLGGHLALEDGILPACQAALARFESAGAEVQPVRFAVDLDALWQAWLVWRRALVAPRVAALLALRPDARQHIKPEALWEHDQAQGLDAMALLRAGELRSRFHDACLALWRQVDLLALPVTQAWPFALGERWPAQIAGRPMDTYHRWMESTLYATFAGAPAISLPAGFHANGRWPAGLQLIAPPRADARLLQAAAAYETLAAGLLARRPPAPAGPPA